MSGMIDDLHARRWCAQTFADHDEELHCMLNKDSQQTSYYICAVLPFLETSICVADGGGGMGEC